MNIIILEMQFSRNLCLSKPWTLFIIIFLVNPHSVITNELHQGMHYLVSAPQRMSSADAMPKMYVFMCHLNASVSNAPEKYSLVGFKIISMTIKPFLQFNLHFEFSWESTKLQQRSSQSNGKHAISNASEVSLSL